MSHTFKDSPAGRPLERPRVAAHRLQLHELVTDGDWLGLVSARRGSRVHVHVGSVVADRSPIEYGYGDYGAALSPMRAAEGRRS